MVLKIGFNQCFPRNTATFSFIFPTGTLEYLPPDSSPTLAEQKSALSLHANTSKVSKVSKHGAYRPQKLRGLLGTVRRGYGGGGEGDYIPIATLSPPE